ncbi:MAG: glycoside hydrolase family 36 protein [Armatimonadota bacterium]|nr:alpha-galactosidase [bacterium]
MANSDIQTTRPDNIELTFGQSAGRPTARYVSSTIVLEEALDHTRLTGLYWSASGQVQRENVASNLPSQDSLFRPLHTFELEIDGQSLHNRWDWVGAYERDGARPGTVEAVVELRHQVRPVTIKVVTRLDGTPVLARWIEITNTGSQPAALSGVTPWCGMLWANNQNQYQGWPEWNPASRADSPFSLGYLSSESIGMEGNFTWKTLPSEAYRIERTAGRTHGSPYFVLRNEYTGELCFMALAWSHNYAAEFSNRFKSSLSFKLGPIGSAPMRVIEPGETVTTPEVHLGMMHCSFDDAVHAWYDHIRASVLPPRPKGKEMFTVAGRVVEEPGDWILREVDIAAEVGVEAFMVDAGWYGDEFSNWTAQRGDWNVGDWMPGGIAGVREYVRNKGMLFGLWMEPEVLATGSRLRREHPDWEQRTDKDRRVSEALNLGNPEVAKFVEDSIVSVIRDHDLDFYKIDYNISTGEAGQNLRDGFLEGEAWRHFEVLYKTFDRVRKEMPNVALENCASGGGRNDLGMLSRLHYACESDFSNYPMSIRAINSLTLFLPPEAICYYHNHFAHAHLTADLNTHLRVTLFATPIFVGFGAQDANRDTITFRETRRYIELAKSFCRPIMANRPMVYHHTPDIGLLSDADWCVIEYTSRNRLSGYAGVFKLTGAQPGDYIFRPRGLDLSRDYEVTLDNNGQKFRASARELVTSGITISQDTALTSELLLFSAV